MKKKIIIVLVFLSFYTINAQDAEPTFWKFRWGHSDNCRIFEPDSFKQSSMFTGFQWSNTLPMDNALLNNCVAEQYEIM
jgi:hypothetical protein